MDRTITKTCLHCGNEFTIPRCRDWREHCCSPTCKVSLRKKKSEELRSQRSRECAYCKGAFVVKKSQIDAGHGKYCSHQCATDNGAHAALFSTEAQEKSKVGFRKALAEGRVRIRAGAEHPCWKGGKAASVERHRARLTEKNRIYRKNNPHKVREFTQRRSGRKIGRLPRGTIKKLFEKQKGRCIVCRIKLEKYHVDHIEPLALGGKHVPENLQLLCPTCNIRKSAKDPIEFMQSRGFLL